MKLKQIILAAAAVLAAPSGAVAQFSDVFCDDSLRLEHRLGNVLGAERRAIGLRDPETVLEIWIHPEKADWTVVQTYANGTSCIVAMGEHWEQLATGPA